MKFTYVSPYFAKEPNVVRSPFVLVCRIECLCPMKQGVSRKRWNKAGSFARLALCREFCVPCNVLKIAWGRVAKSWMFEYVQDAV